MAKQEERLRRLQEFAYRAARLIASPYFTWRFAATIDRMPALPPPYVVVANHVTELDFYFTGKMFSTPLGFVVGQGLLQNRFMELLLVKGFGCISKQKGTTDVRNTMQMLRRLRSGRNICLFVEGNTTFDGRTGPFPPATGGLLKAMGAGLITCRIEGAYFALPRWGCGLRRGRTAIRLVNAYPKETLAQMDAQEINHLLTRDLAEDAYLRQLAQPVAYRGRQTAQGLEHALYLCPLCESQNSLLGQGDTVLCTACHQSAVYTPYGMLAGDFPHTTIRDWCDWQKERLAVLARQQPQADLVHDPQQTLFLQDEAGRLSPLAEGRMRMSRQTLAVGEYTLPIADLTGFEIYRKNILQLSTRDGRHLQTGQQMGFNALKYRDLYDIIRKKEG